jgi:hypothetical protein
LTCPNCGSTRTGSSRTVPGGRICWDCGSSFEAGGPVATERRSLRRRLPQPSRASRTTILLALAIAAVALVALLGLFAIGFFDWVRCSIDNTASC